MKELPCLLFDTWILNLVYSDMGLSPSGRQGAYPGTKSVCFESFVPFAINSCS